MRALVTGATGFVGNCLLSKLERPVVLSRNAAKAEQKLAKFKAQAFAWNPLAEAAPAAAFAGVDTVFHLAGESVAEGRWTAAKKIRMRESRVTGTRNLVNTLAGLSEKPKVLVCASAIGYYGDRGADLLEETAQPANDYLGEMCVAWEREAAVAKELGIRVVSIRIGIVLGKGGGALGKMLTPFYLGVGSPLGSGKQYMSWIHLNDLVGLMLHAAKTESVIGPVNGTAPHPVTNLEFTKELGKAVHRPTFFPAVPGFALRLVLGEFAAVLLGSQRCVAKGALDSGYSFQFSELGPALADIVKA